MISSEICGRLFCIMMNRSKQYLASGSVQYFVWVLIATVFQKTHGNCEHLVFVFHLKDSSCCIYSRCLLIFWMFTWQVNLRFATCDVQTTCMIPGLAFITIWLQAASFLSNTKAFFCNWQQTLETYPCFCEKGIIDTLEERWNYLTVVTTSENWALRPPISYYVHLNSPIRTRCFS